MRFFSIFVFFAPSDSRFSNGCISAKYCPILTNHTSMGSLHWKDWFCGPGSHIVQALLLLLWSLNRHCIIKLKRFPEFLGLTIEFWDKNINRTTARKLNASLTWFTGCQSLMLGIWTSLRWWKWQKISVLSGWKARQSFVWVMRLGGER